jgi:hypothetical protein
MFQSQHFAKHNFFLKLLVAGILFFVISCSSGDPYLYDRPGFDEGNSPSKKYRQNPEGPNRVAPDYYYRQPAYPPQGYAPQQPYYYPPQQQPYYAPQPSPGSRFYSNPYAIPPTSEYPYYDADQYYVPPTSYYDRPEQQGVIKQNGTGGPF